MAVSHRSETLFNQHYSDLLSTTDLLFAGLLAFQWLAAIVTALVVSPRAWAGASSQVHPHVWAATLLGGARQPADHAWRSHDRRGP